MNSLGIDFGTKKIGFAIAIDGIISPLNTFSNNKQIFSSITSIIKEYKIQKIYIGLSEGIIANLTFEFINELKKIVDLPVETVDESVSTIEANNYISPKNMKYKNKVDAISAAIILQRAII